MKFNLILLLFIFTFSNLGFLQSQTNSQQNIHFNISVKKLSIEGYEGTEILIEEDGIYINILDDDCLKKMIAKSDEEGIFLKRNTSCVGELKFKIPQNKNLFISESVLQTISVLNYEGKVEIEGTKGLLNLIEVTGPLLVNCFESQILVVFSEFHQGERSNISSMGGEIQVYMPDSVNATLDISGRKIKTDLDMPLEKRRKAKKRIASTLNGGGQKLEIYCPTGQIAFLKRGD